MNKKIKYIAIAVLVVILLLSVFLLLKDRGKTSSESIDRESSTSNDSEISYLLDTYPLEQVPLYKVTEVSSSKLYINWDPNNISIFDDKEFSYYNVVFYTESSQEELLKYYKGIFDKEIVDEYPMPDMVNGYIGKYRVSAAHYSGNTAYIQVHLPKDEFTKENMYFDTYPDFFEKDSLFVEHENSYGLLNQLGGQTEYTRYFTVIDSGDQDNDGKDDVDEFGVLISKYKEIYESKDSYEYDSDSGQMKWEEEGYKVIASFARDHGRVYLNIRGSIEK